MTPNNSSKPVPPRAPDQISYGPSEPYKAGRDWNDDIEWGLRCKRFEYWNEPSGLLGHWTWYYGQVAP